MDILVALGDYIEGFLDLLGVGIRFEYLPGTVVAILGRVIAHSADCDGDRACITYYMKEKSTGLARPVATRLVPTYSTIDNFNVDVMRYTIFFTLPYTPPQWLLCSCIHSSPCHFPRPCRCHHPCHWCPWIQGLSWRRFH
jgi:hypothetical protein